MDVEDLQVKSSAVLSKPQAHSDPAIIQSCYAHAPTTSTSASVGASALTGQGSHAAYSSLARPSYPDTFSHYQSGATLGSRASLPASTNINGISSSAPMYWQGYTGGLDGQASAQQQSVLSQPSSAMPQDQLQLPLSQAPTSIPYFIDPAPLTFTPAATSSHFGISSPAGVLSSVSSGASQPSHPLSSLPYPSTNSSFSSSNQELNASMYSISSKAGSSALPILSMPSLVYSSASILGSAASSLTTLPPLLAHDQFSQSRLSASSFSQRLSPEKEDMADMLPQSSDPPLSVSSLPQAPFLPLSLPSQQGEVGVAQFTEEFDFAAMNEKFNKDEVWGSLGKSKPRRVENEVGENPAYDDLVVEEGCEQDPKLDRKHVYNKDDFFDNLSCNSLNRGSWSGRAKFSDRMKLDTETFGNFQQRTHLGRGIHGPSHSGNFRGSYNRGRGYGYCSGRGRGGYRPA
ncbi:protein decapping 5 [Cocos nucifera]|uniref:Protein decapping 5 n=1 Tax=Cocos nucifera TaxID=13894 RepID=A0A8K0N5J9_COCNU|nr:protein decapping 5 [Cocos nucifera]